MVAAVLAAIVQSSGGGSGGRNRGVGWGNATFFTGLSKKHALHTQQKMQVHEDCP